MNRNCEKCIYHISGYCSAWDCKMTTLEDYKAEVIDRFADEVKKTYANMNIPALEKTTVNEVLSKVSEKLKR
jgi:hypothetical protein